MLQGLSELRWIVEANWHPSGKSFQQKVCCLPAGQQATSKPWFANLSCKRTSRERQLDTSAKLHHNVCRCLRMRQHLPFDSAAEHGADPLRGFVALPCKHKDVIDRRSTPLEHNVKIIFMRQSQLPTKPILLGVQGTMGDDCNSSLLQKPSIRCPFDVRCEGCMRYCPRFHEIIWVKNLIVNHQLPKAGMHVRCPQQSPARRLNQCLVLGKIPLNLLQLLATTGMHCELSRRLSILPLRRGCINQND